MNPMCAAASDKPTVAAEKNSFERSPRNVSAFASRNFPGCAARYSGSAPGITRTTVSAESTPKSSALAISWNTKLP